MPKEYDKFKNFEIKFNVFKKIILKNKNIRETKVSDDSITHLFIDIKNLNELVEFDINL